MTSFVRRIVVPALIVTALVGLAATLAVPDEAPEESLSPEEIARIDTFVERFRQGQRLMGSGRDADAEQVFRDLLAEEPEAAAVHHALGTLLQFRNQPDAASMELRRAAELAPADPVIQRDCGLDLLRRGFPGAAEPYLSQAHKLWPEEVEVLVAHATALRSIGRADDALSAFREAVRASPRSVDARVGLGAMVVATHPEKAVELVADLPHNFADVSLVHGLALERLNRPADAVPHLERAALRSPQNRAGVGILANATEALARLAAREQVVAAARLWCQASGDVPALAPSTALAEGLVGLGRPAEALAALEKAATGGADAPTLRHGLLVRAAAVLLTGDSARARREFGQLAQSEEASPERAIARRVTGDLDDPGLLAALGSGTELRNDAAWAGALAARLAGDTVAATAAEQRVRALSRPAGEFPGLLVMPVPP